MLMLCMLATFLGYWLLKIVSQSSWCYLKNHCINTRLVCTHLNAFYMLNPNITMKVWISNTEKEGRGIAKFDMLPAPNTCPVHIDRVKTLILWRYQSQVMRLGLALSKQCSFHMNCSTGNTWFAWNQQLSICYLTSGMLFDESALTRMTPTLLTSDLSELIFHIEMWPLIYFLEHT